MPTIQAQYARLGRPAVVRRGTPVQPVTFEQDMWLNHATTTHIAEHITLLRYSLRRLSVSPWWNIAVAALFAVGMQTVAPSAEAGSRDEYLLKLLRTSPSFRVRVQVALSLGNRGSSDTIRRGLVDALNDKHPAVRAASAASLGKVGNGQSLDALRRATRDRDAAVRRAAKKAMSAVADRDGGGGLPARFYVKVGRPSHGSMSNAKLEQIRGFVAETVGAVPGVRLAPAVERKAKARQVIRRARLNGYQLEMAVSKVEHRGNGIRAVVSVIVATYPKRNMRAMLSGAATATGNDQGEAEEQAIRGAFMGALRGLERALDAAAARDS